MQIVYSLDFIYICIKFIVKTTYFTRQNIYINLTQTANNDIFYLYYLLFYEVLWHIVTIFIRAKKISVLLSVYFLLIQYPQS